MTKVRDAEKQSAKEHLLGLLKPGDTVYTTLDHVSRSGMTRVISCKVIKDNVPLDITYLVGLVGDYSRDAKRHGLRVSGCGMDMGFSVVYNLSSVLFRDGFDCTGNNDFPCGCPSNDHSNGDRNYEPHRHQTGGYALRQRWM